MWSIFFLDGSLEIYYDLYKFKYFIFMTFYFVFHKLKSALIPTAPRTRIPICYPPRFGTGSSSYLGFYFNDIWYSTACDCMNGTQENQIIMVYTVIGRQHNNILKTNVLIS